jgi:hypothetical protein
MRETSTSRRSAGQLDSAIRRLAAGGKRIEGVSIDAPDTHPVPSRPLSKARKIAAEMDAGESAWVASPGGLRKALNLRGYGTTYRQESRNGVPGWRVWALNKTIDKPEKEKEASK